MFVFCYYFLTIYTFLGEQDKAADGKKGTSSKFDESKLNNVDTCGICPACNESGIIADYYTFMFSGLSP